MAFYKNYTPGEVFEHTAARENDISQLLNQTQGIGGGRIAGKPPGTVRLKCYNSSDSSMSAGSAVEFDSDEPLCDDCVPVKAIADANNPWGVLEFDLAAGQFGNVIISGPATVFASGTVADYVSPNTADPDVFQFASSGAARVLYSTTLIGEVKKCVILLGGGDAGYSGPLKLVAIVDSDAGTAQAKLVYGANPAESFCGYYMHGGETAPIPVVTSENLVSGTNLIYLKLTVQTDGTLAYALVTSNTAASQTVYQWIGNIVFDATSKTATVTQIHEGNLFLAGVV